VVKGKERIEAIPNSGEKFMTFSFGNLKFIDSYQFMNGSLEKLTESLKNKKGNPYENIEIMKTHFSKEELELIGRKGFYPYEFIDSPEKLTYPGLPPKTFFTHTFTWKKLATKTTNTHKQFIRLLTVRILATTTGFI